MPKARTRKAPVTAAATSKAPTGSSTPESSRALIRKFHFLIKRKSQLENSTGDAEAAVQLAIVNREIEELGGLSAYQRMSTIGQGNDRGGGSHRILVSWLKEMGREPSGLKADTKLRLLEVGALKPDNYATCSFWIDNHPIDLHSQHPSIAEQDFLLMDEFANREAWDLISLSLVVNFVPDPHDRGRMLRLAWSMLAPGGLLFLALPLPCVLNSRYTTIPHIQQIMAHIGFREDKIKWKKDGKMIYWLYSKQAPEVTSDAATLSRKVVLVQGSGRNNFSVLL